MQALASLLDQLPWNLVIIACHCCITTCPADREGLCLWLILFFVSSSLLSKAFAGRKADIAKHFSKGGRRDWAQVAANGGMGAMMMGKLKAAEVHEDETEKSGE